MLKLDELKPAPGSKKKKKRMGRGTSSGHGRTSGRGHKGQKSRSGGVKRPGFEGGQTPLYRRLPKMGKFKNYPFKREYNLINLGQLKRFESGSKINLQSLKAARLIKLNLPLKVLGDGELTEPLVVEAAKFSTAARKKIEAAGGKVVEVKPIWLTA